MSGKIIKGIAGFYYVHTKDDKVYSCKAKGIFRKLGIKPLVGDDVDFMITHKGDMEGNIINIKERKNVLIRPRAANIDQALLFLSLKQPDPDFTLLDSMLIYMSLSKIPLIIYFNKTDLDKEGKNKAYKKVYEEAGYEVLSGCVSDEITLYTLRKKMESKTTVLVGPSGVGKSSLANRLLKEDRMEVGDLSIKLKRGKNTTRHVELLTLNNKSYLMDTPGFSSFELSLLNIDYSDLKLFYNEFSPYLGKCKFSTCSHVFENADACAVKKAVKMGEISLFRYESYCKMYTKLYESRRIS